MCYRNHTHTHIIKLFSFFSVATGHNHRLNTHINSQKGRTEGLAHMAVDVGLIAVATAVNGGIPE